MKKAALLLSLLSALPLVTGCSFFDDDSWKDEFGTPELVLENAVSPERRTVYQYGRDPSNAHVYDENSTVSNAILSSSPYEAIEKRDSTAERFFTLEAYVLPATSGPNYCHLIAYEDGLMVIHYKSSLGPHHYRYFSFDTSKALALVDLVFGLFE